MSTTLTESQPSVRHPSFREAFRFWLKLGFISFGGPTGQIAIMHTELVEKKSGSDSRGFCMRLNFCMLLPGPEAQQLAIYIGWLLHKTRGGILPVLFLLFHRSLSFGRQLRLCRVRQHSVDRGDLLWTETGRARNCCRGCHSHWKQSPQERGHVVARVGRICRNLFFPRPISFDHH